MNAQSQKTTQFTVFFDLETGGLLDEQPDIQLAAVAVLDHDLTTVGEFQEKIQFDITKADPVALSMNHFDPVVWEREAIPEAEAVIRFADFISQFKCVHNISKRTGAPYLTAKLAGHNAATFDMPRLRRMFRRGNYTFLAADPRVYDTVQAAMWKLHVGPPYPANYKLSTLAEFWNIDASGAHDALADVRLCVKLAAAMRGLDPAIVGNPHLPVPAGAPVDCPF